MNYSIVKSKYNGWEAKQKINIDNMRISISIHKYQKSANESKKIVAFVSVGMIENNTDSDYITVVHKVFSDYSKIFLIFDDVKIINAKKIESAVLIFENDFKEKVLNEINAFYLKKESEVK